MYASHVSSLLQEPLGCGIRIYGNRIANDWYACKQPRTRIGVQAITCDVIYTMPETIDPKHHAHIADAW
jgi:hypothetical protein